MLPHHQSAIQTFLDRTQSQTEFIAILLAGSLAHGYAKEHSDIDIILVADEAEYAKRAATHTLAFSIWDICDYPHGYVDCKVVSLASMQQIADRGSDPARYAFLGAQILRSHADTLPALLAAITRYPTHQAPARQHRFACQLLAWKWYLSQAEEKKNAYLRHLACQKITLFACRLILNHNHRLYPYHKWMLAETQRAPNQPPELQTLLATFLDTPIFATAQQIADTLLAYLHLEEKQIDWPNQFMADSEQNWLHHPPPIDDL